MGNRSVDINDFLGRPSYQVTIDSDFLRGNVENAMDILVSWTEPRTSGQFLVLLDCVLFNDERDAAIFRIGFKYAR